MYFYKESFDLDDDEPTVKQYAEEKPYKGFYRKGVVYGLLESEIKDVVKVMHSSKGIFYIKKDKSIEYHEYSQGRYSIKENAEEEKNEEESKEGKAPETKLERSVMSWEEGIDRLIFQSKPIDSWVQLDGFLIFSLGSLILFENINSDYTYGDFNASDG